MSLPSSKLEQLPLLDSDEIASPFTRDGTLDFRSRPALRARTGGWVACICIIGYEIVERLAYYGISGNLVLYMKNELHQGTASATESVNNWEGATLVLPIFGALLADVYLGRFLTIACLSAFYILGLIMLTLSASLPGFRPQSCSDSLSCPKATSAQLAFFYISLYLIAIGTAGVKPCLEAFGADQFDEEHPVERTWRSSFFNWWYFGINTGCLLAFTVILYIQDNTSYGVGYGILAILIGLASVLFLVGTPWYRNKVPSGSSLVGVCQVFVAAAWKRHVAVTDLRLYETSEQEGPQIQRRQLMHTSGLRCLDKAAMIWQPESKGDDAAQFFDSEFEVRPVNPWKLCTITQVEEVKLIVRIIPIWLSTILFGMIVLLTQTFFVEQAATMDRDIGYFVIPSGSLLSFTSFGALLFLPIYDRVLVPCTRWFTGDHRGITLLQRLGAGLFLSIVCMVIAALVERRRLEVARDYGLLDDSSATVPMSVIWLVPQFLLCGVADALALVGEQEFFYDQVPDSMRSLGISLYLCANGVASYLSSALISIVNAVTSQGGNEGWIVDNLNLCHLDYYYWLVAGLFTLNFSVFLVMAWCYSYKEVMHEGGQPK